MTAATSTDTDPVVEFRRNLPPNAQRSLNVTQAVVALVHAAVRNHGWTPKLLAQECTRDMPADLLNPGALITDRLRKAAAHPPPNQPTRRVQRIHRPGCDGWIYNVPADPAEPITTSRCHGCSGTTSQRGHQP